MNTPAHLLVGAAAFARVDKRWSLLAALGGALAPDLSLYLLAGWHLGVLGTSAQVVFDELYFSDAWQSVFAVDNSLFVWVGLLLLGVYRQSLLLKIFSASALLHIALDFPLHAGDGRPHFWLLTDWVFFSPISYWDDRFYGWLVGPAELLLAALCTLVLFLRYRSVFTRSTFLALFALEAASSGIWVLVF